MPLQAPFWQNTQKMQFHTDAGQVVVLQNNPSKYSFLPVTDASVDLPVQMGAAMVNGPYEYPPNAIPLHWDQMSKTDYDTLRTQAHLQMGTMIDMNDQGFYGMLKLGKFDWGVGAQQVGSVDAVFMAIRPANGLNSTVKSLSAPPAPAIATGGGGSIPSSTALFYAMTWWTIWGESLPSPVFSANTGAQQNAANTITWSAPLSGYYRKARIYIASNPNVLIPGNTAFVLAEIWAPFTQYWIDVTGLNGLRNTATIPSKNTAFTGQFVGGIWQNFN